MLSPAPDGPTRTDLAGEPMASAAGTSAGRDAPSAETAGPALGRVARTLLPRRRRRAKSAHPLADDLRHALEAGDLAMHYQPQVDGDGAIIGAEALLRWTHPTLGPIPPADVVKLAQEIDLLRPLSRFTLAAALRDSARWPGLKLAMNIAAEQLAEADFVADLKVMLDQTGAAPDRIELEITEGSLVGYESQTRATLEALRAMGVKVALDDFGTGFSGLSYLQRFSVDTIKIDRSFVEGLGSGAAGAIVGAIVALAGVLGIQVVAEGVETQDQRRQLLAIGCPNIQGFLISEAVPADEFEALARGGQPPPPGLRLAS